jgi:hypothetical protein
VTAVGTLTMSAMGAVLPWNSLDAESELFERLPQQRIEICLLCQHSASHCDVCGDWNAGKRGRPRKEIDRELLREAMKLRRCNKEMCQAIGVGRSTLINAKKDLEDDKT